MKQEYFVVVLAHSLRGRLRRVHIPHTAVYAILALALLGPAAKPAKKALEEISNDPNETVRKSVVDALFKIGN